MCAKSPLEFNTAQIAFLALLMDWSWNVIIPLVLVWLVLVQFMYFGPNVNNPVVSDEERKRAKGMKFTRMQSDADENVEVAMWEKGG